MDKPSQKLSQKIIERLIQEKLLTQQQGKQILPKIEEGKIRTEDWKLAIELSIPEEDML